MTDYVEFENIDSGLHSIFETLSKFHEKGIIVTFDEPENVEKLDDGNDPYKVILQDLDLIYDDEISYFQNSTTCPVCAVDVGATKIGETSDGPLVAYRGCIVRYTSKAREHFLYRTGPILLSNRYKKEILHIIGKELGNEELFVEMNDNKPTTVKAGAADNTNQYSDRIRNFIERKLQEKAVQMINNGIILFDGALTKNTRDTPTSFIENNILFKAFQQNNYVLAISKKSSVLVNHKPISFSLEDHPFEICYRNIQQKIDTPSKRNFGEMYAARFSEFGQTFRVDVCVPFGADCRDALNKLWFNCNFRNGYPEPLIRAHIHTYIPWSNITQMKAHAIVDNDLIVKNNVELGGAFAPFGGGFK